MLWLSGLCLSVGLLALSVFTVLVRPWNRRTRSSSDKIQLVAAELTVLPCDQRDLAVADAFCALEGFIVAGLDGASEEGPAGGTDLELWRDVVKFSNGSGGMMTEHGRAHVDTTHFEVVIFCF